MQNPNKHLHRLLIILVAICIAAITYLFLTDTKNGSLPIQNTQTEQTSTAPHLPTSPTHNTNTSTHTPVSTNTTTNPSSTPIPQPTSTQPSTPTSTPPTTNTSTEGILPVTFTIQDTLYALKVKPNTSVYDAMLVLKDTGHISFATKNFSGLGEFVTEINGIKNNPSTGYYWTYYINNNEATVGISSYMLKLRDNITWKYFKK